MQPVKGEKKMLNMIKADLYRIVRGKGIYILLFIMIVMASVSVYMKEAGYIAMGGQVNMEEQNADIDESGFVIDISEESDIDLSGKKVDTDILNANMNLYYLFIILVSVIVMGDFSSKTIKNTLTSAVDRKTYFASKFILTEALAVLIVLINNFFAYTLNYIMNGKEYASELVEIWKVTLRQIPMLLGVVSLLVLAAFFIRKAAVFNAVTILFQIIFQVLIGVIIVITKSEILRNFMGKYEIQTALSRLVYTSSDKYVIQCACIGFTEIIVSIILGYILFRKVEIK